MKLDGWRVYDKFDEEATRRKAGRKEGRKEGREYFDIYLVKCVFHHLVNQSIH